MSKDNAKQITFYFDSEYKDVMTRRAKGEFGTVAAYLRHLVMKDLRESGRLDAKNNIIEEA